VTHTLGDKDLVEQRRRELMRYNEEAKSRRLMSLGMHLK
jgi:hypothetical protein